MSEGEDPGGVFAQLMTVKARPGLLGALVVAALVFFGQRTIAKFDDDTKDMTDLKTRVMKLEIAREADQKALSKIEGTLAVIHDVIVAAHLIDAGKVEAIEGAHRYGDKPREQ